MIVLFTDFGVRGPYVGQMKNVLWTQAPAVPVLDLMHDVPAFAPELAAYLLAAYVAEFAPGTVFLCVVDPGVGTAQRQPVVVQADERWFVGPDNGLFALVSQRARQRRCWRSTWQPPRLSASFHGRDLFAPVAARLANGEPPPGDELAQPVMASDRWPEELFKVIYCDAFGNVMTGVRAAGMERSAVFRVKDSLLHYARTFAEVAPGTGFWYENANGLVEFAVNQGAANRVLDIAVGEGFELA